MGALVRTLLASGGGTIGNVRDVILFFRWYFESECCREKYTYIFCLGKGTDITHSFHLHWQLFADSYYISWASLVAQMVKNLPAMWETKVWSLGQEDPLEKEMATHSSTLAWKIPWMEEPGRLQSMGSQRVGNNWATSLSFSFFLSYKLKYQQILFFFFWSGPFLKSLLNLLQYCFCFMFSFFDHETCGIKDWTCTPCTCNELEGKVPSTGSPGLCHKILNNIWQCYFSRKVVK